MKKVLFVATVVRKHINVFHLPFLKMFQSEGYRTYVAASNDTDSPKVKIPYCDEYFEINFKRNPLHPKNFLAYLKLKKIIKNNNFDIIHCHTPVGGLIGRLAAIGARKKGTKLIYTAHGFHFFKGAPLKNWLFYYPVEKLCSYFTDTLITINQEDYALAQKKMKAKRVEYVPGVGIDVASIRDVSIDIQKKREKLGLDKNAFVLLSVGEINENKNHISVIKAIAELDDPNLHYAIVGCGDLKERLEKIAAECGVADRVHLLGYRSDVCEILKAVNAYVHPSFREGLPVSVMEALASGLPIICSKIRGNVDVVEDGKNGIYFDVTDASALKNAIKKLYAERDEKTIGLTNSVDAERFDFSQINEKMYNLYFETEVK